MLANADLIRQSLEHVKESVQASIQSERAREGNKAKPSPEQDHPDMVMFDASTKGQYAMSEVKKRRGVSHGHYGPRKHRVIG